MKLKYKLIFSGFVISIMMVLFYVIYLLDEDNTFNAQNDNNNIGPTNRSNVVNNEIKVENKQQFERKEKEKQPASIDPMTIEAMQTLDNEILSQADISMESALFREKYSNPRNFALLEWHSGISYEMVRDFIKEEQLPILYEMLKDKNYVDHWDKIAVMIGYISKDPESVPVLLEYLQRDDSWYLGSANVENITLNNRRIMGKIAALSFIGLIGGEQANTILKEAISEKEAEQLINNWNKDLITPDFTAIKSQKELIDFIKDCAILGIVYSGNEENIEIIKNLYEIEEAKCREIKALSKERSKLHYSLVESMGKLDYIAEHSLEEYLCLEMEDSIKIGLSYASKYCPLIEDLCKQLNIETK